MDADHSIRDLNSILEDCSPASTGRLISGSSFYKVQGTRFEPETTGAEYSLGWGPKMVNTSVSVCS